MRRRRAGGADRAPTTPNRVAEVSARCTWWHAYLWPRMPRRSAAAALPLRPHFPFFPSNPLAACLPACLPGRGFPSLAVGLRPGVDVFEGAAAEFVLGLLLAFVVLVAGDLRSRCDRAGRRAWGAGSGAVGGRQWCCVALSCVLRGLDTAGGMAPAVMHESRGRGWPSSRADPSGSWPAELCSCTAPPACSFWRLWLPLLATVMAVRAGAPYSGERSLCCAVQQLWGRQAGAGGQRPLPCAYIYQIGGRGGGPNKRLLRIPVAARPPAKSGEACIAFGTSLPPPAAGAGPSLNPAVTLGWELVYQQQSRAEHLAVFWAAPLVAGLMGGWAYIGMREFSARKQHEAVGGGKAKPE